MSSDSPETSRKPEPANEPVPARSLGRLLVAIAVAGFLPAMWLINARVPRPTNLGVRNGMLAACPDSPNCVVSHDREDPRHSIAPLGFKDSPAEAKDRLKAIVSAMPRTRLIQESGGYLRYEFRTRFCNFVDDVEFHVDGIAKVVHVRSASRIGYSDLGANRRRVERIRAEFDKPSPATRP